MREKCQNFRRPLESLHLFVLGMVVSFSASAQVSRAPANFVPDDDQILVPMVIERNFMDDFHAKHKNNFQDAKKKIRHWLAQEEYAEAYGFDNNGVVKLPTPEEKQKFFERNYLRFITKDVEKSANRSAQEWYENWSADDELASIEAQQEKEEFIIKAKRQNGQQVKDIKSVVKVGKSKIRLDVQPRLEMGMIKVRFRSPYFEGRAWLGINGNQELQLERKFRATNTKTQVNYFIEQKRVLASVDQRLANHLSLRLTHDRIDGEGINAVDGKTFENNVVQLRFGMGF